MRVARQTGYFVHFLGTCNKQQPGTYKTYWYVPCLGKIQSPPGRGYKPCTPATDGNIYINYKTAQQSMSLHGILRVFPSTGTKQRPLVGVRVRVRVKNSPPIFPPAVT